MLLLPGLRINRRPRVTLIFHPLSPKVDYFMALSRVPLVPICGLFIFKILRSQL